TKSFLWGQDLSGSMQGAGGVGGLLSVTDDSSGDVFYATYDANGNVSEYIDETGAIAAHYEYSPFGRVIASTGSPDDFDFRFSTKYQDNETNLLYYGFRYYNPETGRWLSRDPIAERGGLNLYAFVGNNGVNWVDILGLAAGESCEYWIVASHGGKPGVDDEFDEWKDENIGDQNMQPCSRVGHLGCYNAANNNDFQYEHGASHVLRWAGSNASKGDYANPRRNVAVHERNSEGGWVPTGDRVPTAHNLEFTRAMGLDQMIGSSGEFEGKGGYLGEALREAQNIASQIDCGKGCCEEFKVFVSCSSEIVNFIRKSGNPGMLSVCHGQNGGKPAAVVKCDR
ncbi:MAG: RHS repeat domain-containing protein, partial [Verrucomicrobiales bacterium]